MMNAVITCSRRISDLLIEVENSDEVLSKAYVCSGPTFFDNKPLFPTRFLIGFVRDIDCKSTVYGLSVEYSYFDRKYSFLGSNTVKIMLLGVPPEGKDIFWSPSIRNDDGVPYFSSTGERYIDVGTDDDFANTKIVSEIIRISEHLSTPIIDE